MRIVEPKNTQTEHDTDDRQKSWSLIARWIVFFLVVGGVVSVGWIFIHDNNDSSIVLELQENNNGNSSDQKTADLQLGEASGEEKYQALWYALTIKDTITPEVAPDIDNDTEFTRLTSSLAEARGYKIQKIYNGDNLMSFRGVTVEESVIEPLRLLIAEADKYGLVLSVSSAYRSLEDQEIIFLSRYRQQLANGKDEQQAILTVLEGAAPPGYSKHHSGYTIDMTCSGLGAKNFIGTACDVWLSKNDYENAKKFGFIPSYPKEVDVQGPAPEPWEYNYVGTQLLSEVNLL